MWRTGERSQCTTILLHLNMYTKCTKMYSIQFTILAKAIDNCLNWARFTSFNATVVKGTLISWNRNILGNPDAIASVCFFLSLASRYYVVDHALVACRSYSEWMKTPEKRVRWNSDFFFCVLFWNVCCRAQKTLTYAKKMFIHSWLWDSIISWSVFFIAWGKQVLWRILYKDDILNKDFYVVIPSLLQSYSAKECVMFLTRCISWMKLSLWKQYYKCILKLLSVDEI